MKLNKTKDLRIKMNSFKIVIASWLLFFHTLSSNAAAPIALKNGETLTIQTQCALGELPYFQTQYGDNVHDIIANGPGKFESTFQYTAICKPVFCVIQPGGDGRKKLSTYFSFGPNAIPNEYKGQVDEGTLEEAANQAIALQKIGFCGGVVYRDFGNFGGCKSTVVQLQERFAHEGISFAAVTDCN